MMNNNKVVRLTESDLHNIIKESVNKVLNEASYELVKNASKKMPYWRSNGLINTFNDVYGYRDDKNDNYIMFENNDTMRFKYDGEYYCFTKTSFLENPNQYHCTFDRNFARKLARAAKKLCPDLNVTMNDFLK